MDQMGTQSYFVRILGFDRTRDVPENGDVNRESLPNGTDRVTLSGAFDRLEYIAPAETLTHHGPSPIWIREGNLPCTYWAPTNSGTPEAYFEGLDSAKTHLKNWLLHNGQAVEVYSRTQVDAIHKQLKEQYTVHTNSIAALQYTFNTEIKTALDSLPQALQTLVEDSVTNTLKAYIDNKITELKRELLASSGK